ncbi:putative OTU domain, MULE transposase domain, FHY3/FAR1 family [Helianthus annuus]|nr:putative OTU domain, MULE transposase domain, FHY3/FAR1 family [Helianthus annuus]
MDELVEWCRDVGRVNGYALVTKRTIYDKQGSGQPLKIWLTCDCAGEYKSTATVRRSGTRKTGYKFQLIGAYKKRLGYWDLRVEKAKHNHEPFLYPEGHPSLMRLTPSEERTVEQMTHQNIKPRDILVAIKEQNPHNVSTRNTIYNARAKLGRMEQVGETPMQILFYRLEKVGFVFYHRTSQNGERVEDVFFIHPESNMLWRAFPHVLLIDATYKTNRYKMPLVQIIGVTSTLMSFCIAHAFVSNEKQENFTWVLQRLRHSLDSVMEPRVIVTDRDRALMNACATVFPRARHSLCRWHIQQNIFKHCRKSFRTEDKWERFLYKWGELINSTTDLDYNYWYERIRSYLPRKKNQRDRFVSFWSDQHLNFGQRTTNRAEGQHALLKQYLGDSNYTLEKVVPLIDKLIRNQVTEIKGSIETSRSRTLGHHNKPIFNLLLKKVSHACLELISDEVNEIEKLKLYNRTCACRLYTSCGLSCACRLEPYTTNGQMIPLELIDPFWRKLNLDSIVEPSKVDSSDLDGEFALLKQHLSAQPRELKKNLIQKMKELVQLNKTKLKQPVVQKNTRGRPTLKAQQQRKDDSFTEPSRHSFFTMQDQYSDSQDGFGTQESTIEPTRHSTFVESQSYCTETPMFFGEIAKGAKNSKTKNKVAKSKEEPPDLPLLPVEQVNMFMHFKKFIPPSFYPHLSHIQNVQGDGNCGFRSIAVGLSLKEWQWSFIREHLHDECNRFHEFWKKINEVRYQQVLQSLVWSNHIDGAPTHKWLQMPFTGLLIANRWNVICLLLSDLGCASFFSMFTTAEESIRHRTVALVHVHRNHFIHVRLEGEYPMPTPSGYWRQPIRNTPAESWYHYYKERIDQYNMIVDEYRTRDYIDLGAL